MGGAKGAALHGRGQLPRIHQASDRGGRQRRRPMPFTGSVRPLARPAWRVYDREPEPGSKTWKRFRIRPSSRVTRGRDRRAAAHPFR